MPRSPRGSASIVLAAVVALGCAGRGPSPSAPAAAAARVVHDAAEERFVDSVLARMTLDEKLGQLNQLSGVGEPTGPGGAPVGLAQLRRGAIGSFLNVVGADTTRALQRIAVEETARRIPLLFALDVIHGYRTIFPVPLGEASAWRPESAERAARIAAAEASAEGIMWTFAPMVDIARDPRWGRIVEGAGEDVFLGERYAEARVRGFQGASLRDVGSIAATAKHFAGYGAAEGGRDYNVADVPERTMREVYLPPFHAAVCAGVQTVMASFNEVAGTPAHANHWLATEVLRGEWGFDGLVVSDWTGVGELIPHGIAGDSGTAGLRALNAGVDVDMVSGIFLSALPAELRAGRVSQATVDEATRRVLRLKYRLGLFADPYRFSDRSRALPASAPLAADRRAAAREAGRESIVLLKNDGGALPLRKDLGAIAVIGALAADTGAMNGNWGGMGRASDAVSLLDGIRRAVGARTTVTYARGALPESDDTSGVAEAVRVARRANAVVLVLGETPGMSAEAASRATIDVPGAQMRLARAVRAAGVPVVTVLMNGRPLAIQWLQDSMPAIVETWFPGTEGGNAVADVLFGDYNPGGKLPVTFPRVTGQVPIHYDHRNTGRPADEANHYTSKYIDVPFTPLYPFGHGLSYTTFTYGEPQLGASVLRPGERLRVSVDVTNSGARAGDEVVQLYVRDDVASVTRPVKQLRGFQRIALAPGERRTVSFTLDEQSLAFLDSAMARVVEPGSFTVYVGTSSEKVREAHFRFETADGKAVRVAEGCSEFE